jgi:hypothetical protein
MNESVTVYCTKYALTTGIFCLTGRITQDGYFSEASVGRIGYFLGRSDYRLNREDAIAEFEKRKTAKIASLRKQIAKLEQMEPSIKCNTTTPQEPQP